MTATPSTAAPGTGGGAQEGERPGEASSGDFGESGRQQTGEEAGWSTRWGPWGQRRAHSKAEASMLASLSNIIDENLQLFRAGAAAAIVGSGATLAFFMYRRGFHGFSSIAGLPKSYYARRKRVRVRVSKVVAVFPEESVALGEVGPEKSQGLRKGGGDGSGVGHGHTTQPRPESDVLLQAEHITILRRLLRLPPRSLPPSGGGTGTTSGRFPADTLILRLCGVAATEQGVECASQELTKAHPTVQHCDAELLFREERLLHLAGTEAGNTGAFGHATDAGSRTMARTPVAVCHIHRRRGFWRDVFLRARLDPTTGFGERLISEGLGRLRQEHWWIYDHMNTAGADVRSGTQRARPSGNFRSAPEEGGNLRSEPPPSLGHLLEDRTRLEAAQSRARGVRKGLWAETGPGDEHTTDGAGGSEGGFRPWRWIWSRRRGQGADRQRDRPG